MFELQYSTEYTYMHHVLKFNVLFKSEESKSSNKSSSTRVGARGDCSVRGETQINSPDMRPRTFRSLSETIQVSVVFCWYVNSEFMVRQFRVYYKKGTGKPAGIVINKNCKFSRAHRLHYARKSGESSRDIAALASAVAPIGKV